MALLGVKTRVHSYLYFPPAVLSRELNCLRLAFSTFKKRPQALLLSWDSWDWCNAGHFYLYGYPQSFSGMVYNRLKNDYKHKISILY